MLFVKSSERPPISSLPEAQAFIKGVAAKWTALSEQGKQVSTCDVCSLKVTADIVMPAVKPWLVQAREVRAKYLKEREQWEKNTSETGLRQHRKIVRARRAKKAIKDSDGQRVKRPLSAFASFLVARQKDFILSTDSGATDNRLRMKRAGEAWAVLPEHEKEVCVRFVVSTCRVLYLALAHSSTGKDIGMHWLNTVKL
jgi:hypothetical protein